MGCCCAKEVESGDPFALPPVTADSPVEVKMARLCKSSDCSAREGHYTTRICVGRYCHKGVCEHASSQCACPLRKLCSDCFRARMRFHVKNGNIVPMYSSENMFTNCCSVCRSSDYPEYQSLIPWPLIHQADRLTPPSYQDADVKATAL